METANKITLFLFAILINSSKSLGACQKTKKYLNRPGSLVLLCTESYSDFLSMAIGHTIILAFLAFKIWIFIKFYKTKDLFPLKQRAPNLALWQLGPVILERMWLYFLEWGRFFQWYDWHVRSIHPQIPYLRKFSRFFVKIVRNMFIYIFALRVLVVYTQWKKDPEKERANFWSLWKFFFTEKIPIYVIFYWI